MDQGGPDGSECLKLSEPPAVDRTGWSRHHPGTDLATRESHRLAILDDISKGVTITAAFQRLGYSRLLPYQWRNAAKNGAWQGGGPVRPETLEVIREFCHQMEMALAEGEAHLVTNGIHAAVGQRNEKTGLIDTRPAEFLLTHGAYRENWHRYEPDRNITVNVNQVSEEQKAVRDLTDDKLIELGEDSWRELLPG